MQQYIIMRSNRCIIISTDVVADAVRDVATNVVRDVSTDAAIYQ